METENRPMIKVGSLFSNMSTLPDTKYESYDMNFKKEFEDVKSGDNTNGLFVTSNGHLTFDHL